MSSSEGVQMFKCLNCGGAIDPNAERCQYCHMYYGNLEHWNSAKVETPEPQPEPELRSRSSGTGGFTKSTIYFAVVTLIITMMGSTFTNGSIQADFTAAAVASSGLLGILLFLGAVKALEL